MRPEIGAAFHRFPWFVARSEQLPSVLLTQDHHPFGAVKGIAVLMAFLDIRGPDALFENELALAPREIVGRPRREAPARAVPVC